MSIFILVVPPPPDERADDLVGPHYVAARFGCSVSAVQHRKANTGDIPRVTDKPLRFRRADVHAHLDRLNRARSTPGQKAFRLLERKPRQKNVA